MAPPTILLGPDIAASGVHLLEGFMTKSSLVSIGLVLMVLWILGFLVFKVAGFLIHALLLVGAIMLIAGLVRRVGRHVGRG